jgi:hypothetical protein
MRYMSERCGRCNVLRVLRYWKKADASNIIVLSLITSHTKTELRTLSRWCMSTLIIHVDICPYTVGIEYTTMDGLIFATIMCVTRYSRFNSPSRSSSMRKTENVQDNEAGARSN